MRTLRRICIGIIAFLLSVGFVYAWYTIMYKADAVYRVTPSLPEDGTLCIGSSGSSGTATYTGQSFTLTPVTSTDNINFKNEYGQTVGVEGSNVYIKADKALGGLQVTDIEVSSEDELYDALRVTVQYGTEFKTFAPCGEHEGYAEYGEAYTQPVGTAAKIGMITLWLDGTDDACTTLNANNADSAEITITFGAEE